MPRKRKPGDKPAKGRRQFNVAFPPAIAERIDRVAAALGLDATALLRMVIKENLAYYERRAERVEKGEKPDE